MFSRLSYLAVGLLLVSADVSLGQSSRWSIALGSSYFGDQSNDAHRVTTLKNPWAIGFQSRYHLDHNSALQFSAQSLSGRTQAASGDELSLLASLSALVYPLRGTRVSLFLISGVMWIQSLREGEDASRTQLAFQIGIGSDLTLPGNLILSLEVKPYSDGWNYLGWGTSVYFGYRL